MKPLIVAATQFEIQDCIPLLEEKNIPYLITGVGMTATAYALGKSLAINGNYSYVLNVGIAGSFDKKIALGEVVNILTDTFYELGAEDGDNFITIDKLGFGRATYSSKFNHSNIKLKTCNGITVNKVHGNEDSIQKVCTKHPDVTTESMEGAAVFYVCHQENTPCVQVRSISNYVEHRDKSTWEITLALKNLNGWLKNYIEKNY